MTDRVTFEVGEDHVGVVTLNRPDKLNAMDWAVFDALHDVAAKARAAIEDRSCRAVLVTGAGRAFSAGLDLSLFGAQVDGEIPDDDRIDWLQQAFTAFEDLPAPTVAAIRGPAVGAGAQLALACHLRLAAPDAQLGVLEVRWGLVPDLGGVYRLPRVVGLARAIELCMTGRTVDAATAERWGLVNAILDDEDFASAAHGWTARLAAGPPVAVGALPGLLRASLDGDRAEILASERRAQAACLSSADFAEAVGAAMQGRKPLFSGR